MPTEHMTDPREMRKAIKRVSRGRDRVDGSPLRQTEIPALGGLIHSIEQAAYHHGWSGEDEMTALAFHALLRCEALHDQLMNYLCASPSPVTFVQSAQKDKP